MKKTKTVLAFLLAALLLLATAVPAFAAGPRVKISSAPAQAPYKAIEMPTDASPDVDWDAVMDGIWNFMFVDGSGSSYDLSQYHIPATESNKNYIFSVCNNSPRFLHMVPRLSWFVDGDLFAAIFTDLNVAANRAKYDACVSAMDQLLYGIKGNNSLSDVDKCLLVHDRLAAWVAYDTVNLHAGTLPEDAYSPYGPLALHSGVCNGYALAYNWMLEELGFTTYYTSSDTLNHGWSKVKLNGRFYYVDVTWDDPTEDIPGKVSHNQFLLSGSTCSARHRGATDFDMTPDDTRYESYITDHFGSEIRSEIVLIGNKYYYFALDGNYCYLTSRDVNGGIESAKKLVKVDHWVTSDNPQYLTEYYPTLAAIGTTVLYTNGRAVYAYDTTNTSANYEPAVCYTPGNNLFPEDHYFLRGIQQTNGTVSVTAGPALFSQSTVANYTESFVYCTHPVTDVLSSTPGPDCQTHGDAELICTACRALIDGTGQGPTGAHSYTAQTVKAQALKSAATCQSPAVYYYSCSGCGMVENNAGHTFTSGSPSAHTYTAQTVKAQALKSAATCQSPAVYYYSCANCGAVEKNNSHTFTSGSASAHNWQWIEDKAATCSVAGTKHEECSVCHTKRNENTAIPATGNHTYTAQTVKAQALKTPATCTRAATYYYSCSGCGMVENNAGHTFTSGSPSAHTYTAQTVKAQALKSAATCQSPAVYYYSCTNCGAVEKNNSHTFTSGSASAHNWQWIEDKAATCSVAGTKHEECSVCHTKRNENTAIPATGNHAASGTSLVGKVDPSCTANGYSGDTVCKGCGALLSKGHTENALGHTAPNSKGDCSRCGVHLKDVEPDNGKPAGDCKYCGETHTGLFGWLTKIIHSILALFGLHK